MEAAPNRGNAARPRAGRTPAFNNLEPDAIVVGRLRRDGPKGETLTTRKTSKVKYLPAIAAAKDICNRSIRFHLNAR